MTLSDKIFARRAEITGRKSFSEPPFWAQDAARLPFLSTTTLMADREEIENDFVGYIRGAFKSNGVVFALILARQTVFSEARFQWRRFENGRPQDLFGTDELRLLERPWPGGTTGELLAHMEQDASLAGNFFATSADNFGRLGRRAQGPTKRIVRMRPDWVTIVIDSASGNPWALDSRIVAYLYQPMPVIRGPLGSPIPPDETSVLLTPDEVCHYSPNPDPEARFRGMSWLTPVLREIQADSQSTIHKEAFLRNGATPNIVVKFDKDTAADAFDEFVEGFNASHRGAANAYKCLHPDTEVSMWDGRRLPASEVSIGDRVVAWADGRAAPGTVSAAEWQPNSPIVTVTTQRGRVVKTNDRHPFLLADGQWVDAADVQPGDRLVPGLGWAIGDEASPDTLTVNEAWAIGLLAGDGCTVSTTPVISAWDKGVRERIGASYLLAHTGKGHDYRVKGIVGLVKELGLFSKRSWEKRIPEAVMMGSAKVKAAFLSGLIDADGHVADPAKRRSAEVGITSTSRGMLADAQHLLASLGVNASLSRPSSMSAKTDRNHDGWRLCVFGNDQAGLLVDVLDLACAPKAQRLAEYATRPSKQNRSRYDRVASVEVGAPEPTIGIEVSEHHTHVTGGIVTHNTLFLMGGADVSTIGTDFRQLDFSATVGKGESRLASAAGVPPSWVGFSEGLQGSALNAGNFAAARRRFADGTIRPMWRQAAASLQSLVTPPDDGAELWYDDRDIAFLREDQGDQANIQFRELSSITMAVREGFTHDSAIRAVTGGDLTLLEPQLDDNGEPLRSVQLQPPELTGATAVPTNDRSEEE